jgi:hypothetical protein
MRLQALLPLLVHRGEPRSALVVGLGTGITCGALLRYPDLERRVCIELLPPVVRASGTFRGNYDVTTDSRVEIRIGDGRRELRRDGSRYDLITLEPSPPSASGVVNLYSRDFYELARGRLADDGILAQWWPLPTQNDEDSRSLVRSFLDAFPHVSLWTTEIHEMLLLGSMSPLLVNHARIAARLGQEEVASALSEVGVDSEAALLATWVTDREGLERYVGGAPPVTDLSKAEMRPSGRRSRQNARSSGRSTRRVSTPIERNARLSSGPFCGCSRPKAIIPTIAGSPGFHKALTAFRAAFDSAPGGAWRVGFSSSS